MKTVQISLIVSSLLLGFAAAYPVSDGEYLYEEEPRYVDFVPLRRVPRGAVHMPAPYREKVVVLPRGYPEGPVPMRPGRVYAEGRADMAPLASQVEPITAETGYGHSSSPYDYVDYGAYTGGYGAFGWYSDHPVQTGGHGYRR